MENNFLTIINIIISIFILYTFIKINKKIDYYKTYKATNELRDANDIKKTINDNYEIKKEEKNKDEKEIVYVKHNRSMTHQKLIDMINNINEEIIEDMIYIIKKLDEEKIKDIKRIINNVN